MKNNFISIIVAVCIMLSIMFLVGCNENFPPLSDVNQVIMTVGEKTFDIVLYDNDTVNAFKAMLPMTLNMSDMEHEKYYYLPQNFPTDSYSPGTINKGDVMLYGSNCLVVFYETFKTLYSYTRIGRIKDIEDIGETLGSGSINVKFELNLKISEPPTEPGPPTELKPATEQESPSEIKPPTELKPTIEPEPPTEPGPPTELKSATEQESPSEIKPPTTPSESEVITKITISINGTDFKASIYDNPNSSVRLRFL